jgi:putative flippase GtrA
MLRQWIRFNAVGIIGFALQLVVLAGLLRFGVHYLTATFVAVEAAVLQNFIWHEQWTWRGRGGAAGRARRLWRFHVLNGLVSVAGNLAMMRLLVGALGVPVVTANVLAVAACSTLNFAVGGRLVWVTAGSDQPPPRLRRSAEALPPSRFALRRTSRAKAEDQARALGARIPD